MRYLSIVMIVLFCSMGFSQTRTTNSYPPYNVTTLIYSGVVLASTATVTVPAISIKEATDFRLSWTSEDSIDCVVAYVLRNSTTGATTASATIDSAVTTKADGSKGIMTAVALATEIGYDQVKFTIAQSADAHGGTTAGKSFRLYLSTIRRSGGIIGDPQGRIPVVNQTNQFYYKLAFTPTTANDTAAFVPIVGISGLRVFVKSNDSLDADIYYVLKNSMIDSTTAGTKLGSTITHVQPLVDTTTSPGALAIATLIGFDKIKFYIDYRTNSAAGNDGGANWVKLYCFLLRRSD